jgi:hypothetical protein
MLFRGEAEQALSERSWGKDNQFSGTDVRYRAGRLLFCMSTIGIADGFNVPVTGQPVRAKGTFKLKN